MDSKVKTSQNGDYVNKLYEISEVLDKAGENVIKFEDNYKFIVKATKENQNSKKLAVQLVPRYFKFFIKQQQEAVNAMIDLCEDPDVHIRILAVRGFPEMCKSSESSISKISNILCQLLQAEDLRELDNVKHNLVLLLRLNPKVVLDQLFSQILNRDEVLRSRAIQFLKDKVFPLKEEILYPNPEVESTLAENIKKALKDVNGEEFKLFIDFLSNLKSFKGEKSKEILELIAEQADLKSNFKPTDTENIERLVTCLAIAIPFLQSGGTGEKFLRYLAEKVVPEFDKIHESQKFSLLKAIAEMSPFSLADESRIMLPSIFSLIKDHVPTSETVDIKINFTHIECLLYIFHQLASKIPGSLSPICGIKITTGQPSDLPETPESIAKFKDFVMRLKYLDTKTKAFIEQLEQVLKSLTGKEEKQKKETVEEATKTTRNIRDLVSALIQSKPIFLTGEKIQLSWKGVQKRKIESSQIESAKAATIKKEIQNQKPQKSIQDEKDGSPAKKLKGEKQIYVPPRRKENFITVSKRGSFIRGRGRGRGKW